MPISTIDPQAALIVVDLQQGTVGNPTVHPIEGIVDRAADLVAAFRRHGRPVVLANVDGTPPGRNDLGRPASVWPESMTELIAALDQQPADLTVTRRAWSAFAGTDLEGKLVALGVTQIVIAGVATSFGVESTARHGYDHGFNVVVAIDAVTDMRPEAHENSVTRVFPILGETGTSAEIVAALDAR